VSETSAWRDWLNLTDKLGESDPYAWTVAENLVTERGRRLDWSSHRFLLDPFRDKSRRIVVRKAAQLGFTLAYTLKVLHLVAVRGLNVIYTFPTDGLLQDKVKEVTGGLISHNDRLAALVGAENSLHAKRIGRGWLWYVATETERAGIARAADAIVHDEYDRGNIANAAVFESRLGHSEHRLLWVFSNPTVPGVVTDPVANIDGLYQSSDQKHWFIKCQCGRGNWSGWQYLDWPASVDTKREMFVCLHCGRELDRSTGRWVAKYPGREVSGYWLSQLSAPWVSAADVIQASRGAEGVFANMILGLPYHAGQGEPFDIIIDRNIQDGPPPTFEGVMGVDQGYNGHHAVTGSGHGVFRLDVASDWRGLEALIQSIQPRRVYIDLDPERSEVFRLTAKFPGVVVPVDTVDDPRRPRDLGWCQESKADQRVLTIYRTMTVDRCVADLAADEVKFRLDPAADRTREYVSHWQALHAVETLDERTGHRVRRWERSGPDHWAWATIFWWVAMRRGGAEGGPAKLSMPRVTTEEDER
jgi:hypothetical protein